MKYAFASFEYKGRTRFGYSEIKRITSHTGVSHGSII